MHGSQAVLKPCMHRTRVYITCETQLPYIAKTLNPGMLYKVEQKLSGNINETVNRIIDYFSLIDLIAQQTGFNTQK